MADNMDLDRVFHPKSVAIAGVSTDEAAIGIARNYLEAFLRYDFGGRVYPVNRKGGEIRGLRAYPSIKDIPDEVDYVVSCVPAASVPQLVKDCAAKGVKAVQFFTAGFSESDTAEGRRLEAEICDLAREGGVRLIGPNCVGIYCPAGKLSFAPHFPMESGEVAFICQSGGNAVYFTQLCAQRGIRFSKVISYGNACDVNASELLEYLTADPETKIIAAYIEGLEDGKRFRKALKEAAAVKPVILMKGGLTEAGARAAASHTGVLAGSAEVWKGLLQQEGIILVPTLEDLVDMVVTFLYLPVPRGRRLGTIGIGGGATVVATDIYVSTGLVLPPLPQEMQQKLRDLVQDEAGISLNNPVDLSDQTFGPALYPGLRALADYDGIDTLIFHLPLGITPMNPSMPEEGAAAFLDSVIRVHNENSKPIAVVLNYITTSESWETAFRCQRKCHQAGVPTYLSMESAAKALDRFLHYHENRVKMTG